MNQAFQYNLIRFQPNVETGEFAVIGVVVYSPKTHELTYQLLANDQHQRIHDFFTPIDKQILPAATHMIENELSRVQKLLPETAKPDALYAELVREREDIIRFAPAGVIAGQSIQDCTNELFSRYIKRDYPLAA